MEQFVPKNSYDKNNNFDLLRLILASLVFLYHSAFLFGFSTDIILFKLPVVAVDAFFIISGLLIAWSFDSNNNLFDYSVKRLFRIYPIYLILILIQLVIMLILIGTNFNLVVLMQSVKYFFFNILFLNFLQPCIGDIFALQKIDAINGSLWTLKIEVIFYFVLPFIYMLFRKYGLKTLLILYFLSSIYLFYANLLNNDLLIKLFPAHLRFFIVGMALYFYGNKIKFKNNAVISSILIFALMLMTSIYDDLFRIFLFPVVLGLLVFLVGFHSFKIRLKHDVSYGIYIFHFPIIQLMLKFNILTNNFSLFLFVASLIIFCFAFLSAVFIEEKFIIYGKKLIKTDVYRKKFNEIFASFRLFTKQTYNTYPKES